MPGCQGPAEFSVDYCVKAEYVALPVGGNASTQNDESMVERDFGS